MVPTDQHLGGAAAGSVRQQRPLLPGTGVRTGCGEPAGALPPYTTEEGLVASMADRLAAEVTAAGLVLTVPSQEAATILVALVNGLVLEQVGVDRPLVSRDALHRLVSGLVAAPQEDA